MLNTSQRLVNKNSLTWWYVFKRSWRCLQDVFARHLKDILKTSWRDVLKMSWRRLEDVLKTSWRPLEDVLKTSWRRFGNRSWRRLENVWKTLWQHVLKASWRRLENVLKTYGQDEYIGLDQDVFWRRMINDIFVFIKTSWRRLEDVFWRRMFAGYNQLCKEYLSQIPRSSFAMRSVCHRYCYGVFVFRLQKRGNARKSVLLFQFLFPVTHRDSTILKIIAEFLFV